MLRTGVDMVTIDVQVAAVKNAEMRELTAADFDITISGRRRKAASASFMHYDQGTVIRSPAAAPSSECVFGFHRKEDRKTAHCGLQSIRARRRGLPGSVRTACRSADKNMGRQCRF